MNNNHVHSVTAKLKTANINFASFFAKPPNKFPANISGYTVVSSTQLQIQYHTADKHALCRRSTLWHWRRASFTLDMIVLKMHAQTSATHTQLATSNFNTERHVKMIATDRYLLPKMGSMTLSYLPLSMPSLYKHPQVIYTQ